MPKSTFTDGKFSLIPVQPEDIEAIRAWRNTQLDVLRQPRPISHAEQSHYYESVVWPAMSQEHPDDILFTFYSDGSRVGYGGLVHISWCDRRCEVSFLLDPNVSAQPTGYDYVEMFGSFLTLLKEVAFEGLHLNRMFTETYDIRDEHIAVLEANGFAREGVMREHVVIRGRPVDSVIHGCLAAQ